jgi:hypothetical protein
VAGLLAVSQFDDLAVARFLQSSENLLFIIFIPSFFWETFCRVSPRPEKTIELVGSWLLRSCLLYLWAFVLAFIALGILTGVGPLRWSKGSWDSTMTLELYSMHFERATVLALSLFCAFGAQVAFDFSRARRRARIKAATEKAEPSDEHERGWRASSR